MWKLMQHKPVLKQITRFLTHTSINGRVFYASPNLKWRCLFASFLSSISKNDFVKYEVAIEAAFPLLSRASRIRTRSAAVCEFTLICTWVRRHNDVVSSTSAPPETRKSVMKSDFNDTWENAFIFMELKQAERRTLLMRRHICCFVVTLLRNITVTVSCLKTFSIINLKQTCRPDGKTRLCSWIGVKK